MSELHQKLHRAVWKNQFETVRELVHQISDLDSIDEESGWSALHKSLYFGHIRSAAYLIKKGANLELPDQESRTPLDLINSELSPCSRGSSQAEVYSWGSGANYQLGTGKTGLNQPPGRLETLTGHSVVTIASGKFHNLALTNFGTVYSWGWGRGGRLGLPQSKLHSNNVAQILPRVICSLQNKTVLSIAVAKHHSLAVTSTGEVYSWGLNRDGRLGYTTVNKQVTPKRIMSLKGIHAIQASAANKHSAVVTLQGEVYTWGSNIYGQLGYGTSDSASNPTPQRVDSLQHKKVTQVSLSKHHSLALTQEGDVYSWGSKLVAPKKVSLVGIRDHETVTNTGEQIQFHRGLMKVKRPLAVDIAAGVYQSACITTTGCVISWNSADPKSSICELQGVLTGKKAISISAGKSLMAVVTSRGEVYSWDTNQSSSRKTEHSTVIVPRVVDGLRNISKVSVGEKHCLVLQEWRTGQDAESSVKTGSLLSHPSSRSSSELTNFSCVSSEQEDWKIHETEFSQLAKTRKYKGSKKTPKMLSLQVICEHAVAENVLNPRTALQLYEYSDTAGASILKSKSLRMIILNLDLVIYEAKSDLVQLSEHLLLEIEQSYQKEVLKLTEGNDDEDWWLKYWSPAKELDITTRRPTYNLTIKSPGSSLASLSSLSEKEIPIIQPPVKKENRFLPQRGHSISKLRQTIVKKLEQIESLYEKEATGLTLDKWQRLKMAKKQIFKKTLKAIDNGESYDKIQTILDEANQLQQPLQKQQLLHDSKVQKQNSKSGKKQTQCLQEDRKLIQKIEEPLPRFLEPRTVITESSWIPVQSHRDKKSSKLTPKPPPLPRVEDPCPTRRKLSLGDFIAPKPKATESTPLVPCHRESGPVWGGASLKSSNLSFQSIQKEQMNNRPGYRPPDGTVKPAVERMKTVSKWQVNCDVQNQSIRCIQIEERAVRELSELYKGAEVKVKIGTARSSVKQNQDKE
eukprot:g4070.t1